MNRRSALSPGDKPLARRAPLKADPDRTREFIDRGRQASAGKLSRPRPVSPASTAQRVKAAGSVCAVCGASGVDPAHLIDRSLCPEGADDPRAVIGLCRRHHELYDLHQLSLLEYLEPVYREELAFAVQRFGLLSTLQRVTNERWIPDTNDYLLKEEGQHVGN